MTPSEYKEWSGYMKSRRGKWTVDKIHDGRNGRRLLAFAPNAYDSTRGAFIEVCPGGGVMAGTYEGAVPHTGEAAFLARWTRKYPTMQEAFTRVLQRAGIPFPAAATPALCPA